MGKKVTIPWGAWSEGDEHLTLEFPDTWDVMEFPMQGAPDITSPSAIEAAFRAPIGTHSLREIAQGKKTAALVVEDISRPTRCGPICEQVVKELNAAGITNDNITVISALGAHRPMTRADYAKKVGQWVVDNLNVENHHPYENLVRLGDSKKGTPIWVNKTYHDAQVKVAVSTVLPHPLAGFGGGAKIILPGISGIETLIGNHMAIKRGIGIGVGFITDLRKDIEDVCSHVGLDFSINMVTTHNRGIAGLFAGHYIDAHRKAVELAQQVYATPLPKLKMKEKLDVGLFNLFPEDTELSQSIKGVNFFVGAQILFKRTGGVIFMTSSYEGRGYHSLLGETGARLYENWDKNPLFQSMLGPRPFGIFSPHVTQADVAHFWPQKSIFKKNFAELLQTLEQAMGTNAPRCGVFPSSIQLPKVAPE